MAMDRSHFFDFMFVIIIQLMCGHNVQEYGADWGILIAVHYFLLLCLGVECSDEIFNERKSVYLPNDCTELQIYLISKGRSNLCNDEEKSS